MKSKFMTTLVRKTKNLREPGKDWCVSWQTPSMPAPAFWYYRTHPEAVAAELRLHRHRDGWQRNRQHSFVGDTEGGAR